MMSAPDQDVVASLRDVYRDRGFGVVEGLGGTGVVGVLARGAGPVVAQRADMDALPVAEATGLPYASTARRARTSSSGSTSPPTPRW